MSERHIHTGPSAKEETASRADSVQEAVPPETSPDSSPWAAKIARIKEPENSPWRRTAGWILFGVFLGNLIAVSVFSVKFTNYTGWHIIGPQHEVEVSLLGKTIHFAYYKEANEAKSVHSHWCAVRFGAGCLLGAFLGFIMPRVPIARRFSSWLLSQVP